MTGPGTRSDRLRDRLACWLFNHIASPHYRTLVGSSSRLGMACALLLTKDEMREATAIRHHVESDDPEGVHVIIDHHHAIRRVGVMAVDGDGGSGFHG